MRQRRPLIRFVRDGNSAWLTPIQGNRRPRAAEAHRHAVAAADPGIGGDRFRARSPQHGRGRYRPPARAGAGRAGEKDKACAIVTLSVSGSNGLVTR